MILRLSKVFRSIYTVFQGEIIYKSWKCIKIIVNNYKILLINSITKNIFFVLNISIFLSANNPFDIRFTHVSSAFVNNRIVFAIPMLVRRMLVNIALIYVVSTLQFEIKYFVLFTIFLLLNISNAVFEEFLY